MVQIFKIIDLFMYIDSCTVACTYIHACTHTRTQARTHLHTVLKYFQWLRGT